VLLVSLSNSLPFIQGIINNNIWLGFFSKLSDETFGLADRGNYTESSSGEGEKMMEWNLVVTTHKHRYSDARELLAPMGELSDTEYYNVLVMRVEAAENFLARLERRFAENPQLASSLARVLPVTETFSYQSPEEFESKAASLSQGWLKQLADRRFHIRMHRRGFKKRLSSQREEQRLADRILDELARQGKTAIVDFTDPDWILAIDTVGQRAGLSLWSREALQRYPLLKLD
jgi:tRNA(Ser,Leu) C12 N-acetylase TAN1